LISTEIEFSAPETLAGVLSVLAEHEYDVTVLSGGMSLLPMMNLGLATPDRVVSLNRVDTLCTITEDAAELVIGSRVRHVQVAADLLIAQHCPALAMAASRIGDVQVRNRGTIGGSVSHADPSADYLPVLVASGASIVLESSTGGRQLSAREFFIYLMYTAPQPSELVTEIRVPNLPTDGVPLIRFARSRGASRSSTRRRCCRLTDRGPVSRSAAWARGRWPSTSRGSAHQAGTPMRSRPRAMPPLRPVSTRPVTR